MTYLDQKMVPCRSIEFDMSAELVPDYIRKEKKVYIPKGFIELKKMMIMNPNSLDEMISRTNNEQIILASLKDIYSTFKTLKDYESAGSRREKIYARCKRKEYVNFLSNSLDLMTNTIVRFGDKIHSGEIIHNYKSNNLKPTVEITNIPFVSDLEAETFLAKQENIDFAKKLFGTMDNGEGILETLRYIRPDGDIRFFTPNRNSRSNEIRILKIMWIPTSPFIIETANLLSNSNSFLYYEGSEVKK